MIDGKPENKGVGKTKTALEREPRIITIFPFFLLSAIAEVDIIEL